MEWRPFDLHPEYPPEGIATEELDRRYGGRAWRERLYAMFEEAGLPYTRDIAHVPNSRKALQLGELAREHGDYEVLHRGLFSAYWEHGRDIGDDAVLREEAARAGLDDDEVRELLGGDRYVEQITFETQAIMEAGGTGVPAWAIDDRVLVPGAQPHDVFERVLARLGHEPSG